MSPSDHAGNEIYNSRQANTKAWFSPTWRGRPVFSFDQPVVGLGSPKSCCVPLVVQQSYIGVLAVDEDRESVVTL
ncbi:MAG: hypothetical protein B7Z55_06505 [Planctomycetales bacterium 12-60-4]|nr:MAG: hypothetical protein B7Z55_06505 [Planctomycetales bacterium 12-60-4]